MPFQIIRNDITKVKADAIVNTANPKPCFGSGIDKAVYTAAGPEKLLEARKEIGEIKPGNVALTPGFDLPAKYIIHAVGPVWQDGTHGEFDVLKSCYDKSLALAEEKGFSSIAFPLMSTGNNGFPKDRALQIALNAISSFCMTSDIEVTLVVFSDSAVELSGKVFAKIEEYLSSEEAEEIRKLEYMEKEDLQTAMRMRGLQEYYNLNMPSVSTVTDPAEDSHAWAPAHEDGSKEKKKIDPDAYIKKTASLFSYRLNELIEASGEKPSDIYRRAGVRKQVFSKIMSNPGYLPTKNTILAFCLALHLDLDETRDLLARAGHALSPSDKGDRLVEAYIMNGEYDLYSLAIHYLVTTKKPFTNLLDEDDENDILKGKMKL